MRNNTGISPIDPFRSPSMAPLAGMPRPKPAELYFSSNKKSELFILHAAAFLLLPPLSIQIIMQNWELVPVTASLMCIILLSARYAKRPDITHRFAKVLRKVFFVTFSHPGSKYPPKRIARIPLLMAIYILNFVIGMPFAIGHHRPPLINTHRYLTKSGYMDYLNKP